MDMQCSDASWTLITGAAKGVGAAVARKLAQAGHAVVIHYRQSEKEACDLLAALKKEGATAAIIQGSFHTKEATQDFISRYLEQFYKTRYLVNNVGNYMIEPVLATPYDDLQELFQTNLFAPLLITQALASSIVQERGAIVNIGVSGLQSVKADLEACAYTMTKQALLSLTKALAKELAPQGVRVNMISPGRLENSIDRYKGVASIPMKRLGSCEEVAEAVRYILSHESSYTTGQNIDIAGGLGL